MDEGMQFYDDTNSDLRALANITDNDTQIIYIETPEGWKCERKGCQVDYKHKHGTFTCLKK